MRYELYTKKAIEHHDKGKFLEKCKKKEENKENCMIIQISSKYINILNTEILEKLKIKV